MILFLIFQIINFGITISEPTRQVVKTKQAPEPIGPYSQAIKLDNLLFVSGQIAINPLTNQMVDSNIEDETRQALDNIKAILESAGYEMKDVLKSTIYLVDLDEFQKVNKIYGEYFSKDPPARETVQVAKLPKNARVEISVIAGK